MNDILVFKNGELELEVAVSKDRENVWLSQRQMAKLFNVDRTRIASWKKKAHVRKTHILAI